MGRKEKMKTAEAFDLTMKTQPVGPGWRGSWGGRFHLFGEINKMEAVKKPYA
ncbi:hypothetical protein RND71_032692 [Anisodus tanguticus]|uniref:Uncharacterized protein n=1 Tax=Anisodus tanguticus TaxID=243964 RepID=A0AAE1R7S1_9SOLA|nr:hypothetical protein RND71_032692 [Anisodus tanguticus]